MTTENPQLSVADRFDRSHATHVRSRTLHRVYERAYGDEYPADANPNGYITRTALRRLVAALQLEPGQTVIDLGCGHGGPGLWVAQHTEARLIGIDLSPGGVQLAREQASMMGLDERARFQVGDLTATGLPDACGDAAMSLDVLVFVADQAAGAREVARILRPDARFVFTTWEQAVATERLGVEPLADYRPLLEGAGFEMETYEEPPDWEWQHRALLEGIIAAERDLTAEMGAAGAARWLTYARGAVAELPLRRYVFAVARRR